MESVIFKRVLEKSSGDKKMDLRKKLKRGDIVAQRYHWAGEPKREYYYKIAGFGEGFLKGTGLDVRLVGEKINSHYRKETGRKDKRRVWDYEFTIGRKTNPSGWGRAFKFNKAKLKLKKAKRYNPYEFR